MMINPAHSGRIVRREVLDERGLDAAEAAALLDYSQDDLAAFLDGKERVSPELALRLERTFGISKDLLLRLQRAYDEAKAASLR